MPNFDLDLLLKQSPIFSLCNISQAYLLGVFYPHDVASGTSIAEGGNIII